MIDQEQLSAFAESHLKSLIAEASGSLDADFDSVARRGVRRGPHRMTIASRRDGVPPRENLERTHRIEACRRACERLLASFESPFPRVLQAKRFARERLAAADLKVQAVLEEAGGDLRVRDLEG